ncbi:hypothetical protein FC23_GL001012 [Lactobacillus psittaci DSM 15354]|uniref:Uncharacterized protein n=1 Tax=Lactobacillus psittaci DSM 15354 TaxID=1122152 RepID=A0A0R1S264_9LACO|nr:hypothetical protein FC23_GL001012 [Lactobacillus psittaci DSM 15354]
MDRFKTLFGKGKENIKSIEELDDILSKKRDQILFVISNVKSSLNFNPQENHDSDYFKHYKDKYISKDSDITRWDLFFLFAQACVGKEVTSYEWQDVESIIFEVVSMALNEKYSPKVSYKDEITIGTRSLSGRKLFKEIIYYLSYVGKNTSEEVAAELLSELKKFEDVFSKFISSQINLDCADDGYVKNAIDLYENISKCNKRNKNASGERVDVLSFNYSLDEEFKNTLDSKIDDMRLKSWSNIHGIAHHEKTPYYPAPVFGIDNHDIVSQVEGNDFRISFTKEYRVIENGINEVRASNGYTNTDVISIYGHSLGEADYSYFEALFDENDLYFSNCKLEYYYYSGKSEAEKLINRQMAIKSLYKLLMNYGKTLSDTHGANIVTKLNLENRLSLIPSK